MIDGWEYRRELVLKVDAVHDGECSDMDCEGRAQFAECLIEHPSAEVHRVWTVDAMGEAAAKAGEPDLAADVYGAAIAGRGWHVDHLTRLTDIPRRRDEVRPRCRSRRPDR